MDGIAIASAHLGVEPPHRFHLIGDSKAGHPFDAPAIQPGDGVRIFTGAPVPPQFDTVVIQEDCEFESTAEASFAVCNIQPAKGANIRAVGHDIAKDDVIVRRGERLNPFSVGWLSACGVEQVAVTRRPQVSIFSTGDELQQPGTKLAAGQIYDANRILLQRMLANLPVDVVDLGILRDEPGAIRSALTSAAQTSDMLITSAGVSVGDADFVTQVLDEIGQLEIWRLRIKPGKPLTFGEIGKRLFFGLPGNPVSTVVTFLTVVRPALLRLCGAQATELVEHTATLADPIAHKPGREEFQRGRLVEQNGSVTVHITGDQSSNRLATFRDANCFVRIPKDAGDLAVGALVRVLPFWGLL